MKSLRKSLNGNKDSSRLQISTPLPIPTTLSKPSSAILPPQKVIRALTTYKSQAPQELSFSKGDFFYVLKDTENSPWYEAHNPVTGSRGIVPRAMFEEFSKNAMPNRASQFGSSVPSPPLRSASSAGTGHGRGHGAPSSSPVSRTQVYYAIVVHDFVAERPDELDAKRGDAITVVAQSNREWFVAKPIGRLGRPGLIPVSFVEIHDPATGKAVADVDALIDRGDLPKVEEWKRAMLTYKQNSISLGVIDSPTQSSSPEGLYGQREAPPPLPGQDRAPTPECLPEGILLSADVVSFHYEMEEYWFRLDAIFQPYGPPGQNRLPSAKQLILFRVYNDFYDFQVSLLNTFPREAGREPPHPRTLPYMPGPAKDVDDALTATRRQELDEYIHGLCALGKSGGRYILEHNTIRQFLALKPGDVENEIEPRAREIEALLGGDNYPDEDDIYAGEEYVNDVNDQLGRVNLKDNRRSDGSEYEDEGYAPSPQQRPIDRHPYGQPSDKYDRQLSREENLRMQAHANHSRAGSTASFHTQHSTTFGQSRSHSPHKERNPSPTPPRNSEHSNAQSRWADSTTYNGTAPSTASFRSSNSSRSRSHSNATANTNMTNPPISAANPQTAFVKIKIFDRVADDLIAIRVHPKVSHSELMDKVQSRLGSEIRVLKYRDSSTNTFVGLDTDEELRSWMEGTDKHVLYAD